MPAVVAASGKEDVTFVEVPCIQPESADTKAPDSSSVTVRRSVAYQALRRISQIYKLEGALKELTPEQRLHERQNNIQSLVEEYLCG